MMMADSMADSLTADDSESKMPAANKGKDLNCSSFEAEVQQRERDFDMADTTAPTTPMTAPGSSPPCTPMMTPASSVQLGTANHQSKGDHYAFPSGAQRYHDRNGVIRHVHAPQDPTTTSLTPEAHLTVDDECQKVIEKMRNDLLKGLDNGALGAQLRANIAKEDLLIQKMQNDLLNGVDNGSLGVSLRLAISKEHSKPQEVPPQLMHAGRPCRRYGRDGRVVCR